MVEQENSPPTVIFKPVKSKIKIASVRDSPIRIKKKIPMENLELR